MTQSPREPGEESAPEAPVDVPGTPDAPSAQEGAPAPEPAGAPEAGTEPGSAEELDAEISSAEARAQADVAALTADLQRLQAEYLNYKRRVDRDRQLVAENAAYRALTPVIEVLDGVDRAREAGELEGGFKMMAEQLQRAVGQSGLQRFGEPGEEFDPTLHEALSQLGEDPEVTRTTVKVVAKAGYRMGERVVRAAQVLVVEPAAGGQEPQGSTDPAADETS